MALSRPTWRAHDRVLRLGSTWVHADALPNTGNPRAAILDARSGITRPQLGWRSQLSPPRPSPPRHRPIHMATADGGAYRYAAFAIPQNFFLTSCAHLSRSYSLTVFSPSGKLVQIEHALAAVSSGTTSLGIKGPPLSRLCRTKAAAETAKQRQMASSLRPRRSPRPSS